MTLVKKKRRKKTDGSASELKEAFIVLRQCAAFPFKAMGLKGRTDSKLIGARQSGTTISMAGQVGTIRNGLLEAAISGVHRQAAAA